MVLRRWFDQEAQGTASNGKGAIAGAPNTWGLTVARDEWRQAAEDLATEGRLLTLWASRDDAGNDIVRAAFIAGPGVLVLGLPLTFDTGYPGIEQWFPSANRMQRAVAELSGLRTTGPDTRAVVAPRRLVRKAFTH